MGEYRPTFVLFIRALIDPQDDADRLLGREPGLPGSPYTADEGRAFLGFRHPVHSRIFRKIEGFVIGRIGLDI